MKGIDITRNTGLGYTNNHDKLSPPRNHNQMFLRQVQEVTIICVSFYLLYRKSKCFLKIYNCHLWKIMSDLYSRIWGDHFKNENHLKHEKFKIYLFYVPNYTLLFMNCILFKAIAPTPSYMEHTENNCLICWYGQKHWWL